MKAIALVVAAQSVNKPMHVLAASFLVGVLLLVGSKAASDKPH